MGYNKKTAIILGGGPAGLACAYELIVSDKDVTPVIIEKLPCVGGISRTIYDDKLGVDIGGHRFHTKNKYIQSIWDYFLPLQNSSSIDDILAKRKRNFPKKGLNPLNNDNVMLIRKRFSSILYNL